jgi:hypothetical protein
MLVTENVLRSMGVVASYGVAFVGLNIAFSAFGVSLDTWLMPELPPPVTSLDALVRVIAGSALTVGGVTAATAAMPGPRAMA